MEYVVLICARNEEKYIGSCLAAVYFQTLPPKLVIVVDDGSNDETGKRASEFEKHLPLRVVSKPDRGFSAIGSPLMADTYNAGLERFDEVEYNFLLILGADTAIPPGYVQTLVSCMTPDHGVISGRYPGINKNYAAATGRLIRREVMDELGGRLPQTNAWEGSVNHCAQFMGYKRESYPIPIYNLRPPGKIKRSYTGRGRAIKEMGYRLPNALNKVWLYFKMGKPVLGLQILYGYLTHKPQDPLPDWAKYIGESQRKAFKKKLRGFIK